MELAVEDDGVASVDVLAERKAKSLGNAYCPDPDRATRRDTETGAGLRDANCPSVSNRRRAEGWAMSWARLGSSLRLAQQPAHAPQQLRRGKRLGQQVKVAAWRRGLPNGIVTVPGDV